jgi:serine/threonine protein kinase
VFSPVPGKLWGQEVAVKTVKKVTEQELKEFHYEIKIMSGLRHPNIVEFLGAVTDNKDNLCMVTEYMVRLPIGVSGVAPACTEPCGAQSQGSLEDWVKKRWQMGKKISVRTALNMASDIIRGLNWLHHKGIIHRDLKTANMLVRLFQHQVLARLIALLCARSTRPTRSRSPTLVWLTW